MPKQNKRVNKSKPEIVEDMKKKVDIDRRRSVARNELYPILLKGSKSIDHAQIVCQAVDSAIRAKFNKQMLTQNLAGLELEKDLNPSADEHEMYKAIFDILNKETVASAVELISGMADAISNFVRAETHERKLDTLKTSFYGDEKTS